MPASKIICPFCSLHCDDRFLEPAAQGAWEVDTDCPKAAGEFARALNTAPVARVDSSDATVNQVATFVAEQFSSRPILNVVTAGTDLATARHLQGMASAGKIQLLIDDCPSATAWRTASGREGSVTATLADIRGHADLVWALGDVERSHPKLLQRIDAGAKQGILTERLTATAVANLFASIRSGKPMGTAQSIREAKYLAILVGEGAFESDEAIETAELLAKLLWFLNQTHRAVVLSLDPAATNRSVSAWQTNTTLENLSDDRWFSTPIDVRIGNRYHHPRTAIVQIGGSDPGPDHATAYMPARTIGVDQAGVVIRGDSTVTLPLEAITDRNLSLAIEWLQRWL
ncbi:molybdopterin-binding domain-containing protein [Novipirellula artificiosorum]|uniref:Formyltransferase/hydrolase complex Fhc subunit B n=1 Tax=Novipirellula artificiosorum TaxID=2528016 RepID=A0A5C6DUA1_9BACT|nr:hypothetical protein [Novipirellula artificiosorum]TWU40953.1 hypothetical protein Poly41_17880 [Novipirellula artificiosorum]